MYLLPYDGSPELLEKTAILRKELFKDWWEPKENERKDEKGLLPSAQLEEYGGKRVHPSSEADFSPPVA